MHKYNIFSINFQKYLGSLSLNKYRKKLGRYTAEGDKICSWLLDHFPEEIEYLIATEEWLSKKNIKTDAKSFSLIRTDKKALNKYAQLDNGVEVMIIAYQNLKDLKDVLNDDFRGVYLDDVQDPGNVGTIIRTAAWFNFDAVIRSNASADFYNPKVIQSAMGSHGSIHLINQAIEKYDLEGFEMVGALLNGEPINTLTSIKKPLILVIGNESKGISKELRKLLTKRVLIKGNNQKAESLNAAIAFAIIASQL